MLAAWCMVVQEASAEEEEEEEEEEVKPKRGAKAALAKPQPLDKASGACLGPLQPFLGNSCSAQG